MDQLRVSFSSGADCAALRSRARHTLHQWGCSEVVDDTLVVITELVQNVVQHTGDGGELIMLHRPDIVRVEVSDTSGELPHARDCDPRRIGGRGLLVVAGLTRSWGTRPSIHGKTVWADLPLPG